MNTGTYISGIYILFTVYIRTGIYTGMYISKILFFLLPHFLEKIVQRRFSSTGTDVMYDQCSTSTVHYFMLVAYQEYLQTVFLQESFKNDSWQEFTGQLSRRKLVPTLHLKATYDNGGTVSTLHNNVRFVQTTIVVEAVPQANSAHKCKRNQEQNTKIINIR
jgi:hypothetical protein